MLSADYRRLLAVLAARGGSLSCKEIVSALGVAPVHSKTEGVRSKTIRTSSLRLITVTTRCRTVRARAQASGMESAAS